MLAHDEEPPIRGPGLRAVAITALVLAGLWTIDIVLLRTRLLAPLEGAPALVPLYAFWSPLARPPALVFAALAVALVLGSRRLADPVRTGRCAFVAVLFVAALVLPFALFLVRKNPGDLGREFVFYQNDEFYFDARRILELGDFLRYYVELMPQLSLHGQHFPPGHATLLYLVSRVFGDGTLPAGITCLVSFALAVVFAYLALLWLTGEPEDARPSSTGRDSFAGGASRARQGAVILLAAPSMLDFACTSMDAVFLLFATGAWWIGLAAFGPNGRARHAIATGAALFVATCFSFSALPVGLALGLYGVFAGRAKVRRMLGRLAWIGASYAACALLVDLATGFSISACFSAAASGARELMDRAAGRTVSQLWPEMCFGNALAFLLGAGLALVPAAATGVASMRRASHPWSLAVLVTLFVMSVGGIYFLETERIWLFALPWLAAVAVLPRAFTPSTLRLLLAAGLAQALVMEVLLVTLW
jgi:hypothetical protein